LIGIDTPETVHPTKPVQEGGKEASNFSKDQLTGKTVYVEMDVEERD
jgi:micrococcal nuclease